MSTSSYVSSGEFQADLERLVGRLEAKAEDEEDDEDEDEENENDEDEDEEDDEEEDLDARHFIAKLPAPLAREVGALHDLVTSKVVPPLCGLRVGSFVTIPAQHGLDADGVREEEWFYEKRDIEVVMTSIEIFTESGSPYFLIGPSGLVEFDEDPHSFTVIAEGLEPFLRVLLALEAVVRGKGPVAAAEEAVRAHLRSGLTSTSRRRPTRGPIPAPTPTLPRFVARALGTPR